MYEKIIKPPLIESGYEVSRADSLKDRTNILKKIILGMRNADIIIADLTDNNANVFYELGICHARSKNVIMITQNISLVPFDLKQYVLDSYTKDIDDVEKFQISLKGLLKDMDESSIKFENPVLDFWLEIERPALPASMQVEIGQQPTNTNANEKESDDEYSDGVLDVRIRLDGSIEMMTEITGKIPALFTEFSKDMGKHTENMARAGNAKSVVLMHRATVEASETLHNFSKDMEGYNTLLEAQTEDFNSAFVQLRQMKPAEDLSEQEAAGDLLTALNTAIEGAEKFRNSLSETRNINISKAYNKSADRAILAVGKQIDIIGSIRQTIYNIFPQLSDNSDNSPEIS